MKHRMKVYILTLLANLLLWACTEKPKEELPKVNASKYNVIWNSPSVDEEGSMPLGNGDIGANVWMTPDGKLHFYLAKTDAVNENAQLLKLGKVEVMLSPNPINKAGRFEQALLLEDGSIRIRQENEEGQVLDEILVWIDAHNPVVQVEIRTTQDTQVEVDLVNWRDTLRELDAVERHAAYGVSKKGGPVYVYPDTVFSLNSNNLAWAHHNKLSIWQMTLDQQNLAHLVEKYQDPLINRTFGGLVSGNGLVKQTERKLVSKETSKSHQVQVHIKSEQNADLAIWLKELQDEATIVAALSMEKRYLAHQKWWRSFWNRSYIIPSGTNGADSVGMGYTLQRYITACAGRGVLPIKFNGSLFNVAGTDERRNFTHNADYRMWGGPYWFQNTRLIYWPMLESGDFEMMQPLFRMYLHMLPFAKDRVSHYFKHEGAMFPETQYFWGAYAQDNYGWEQERIASGLTDQIGITQNQYIRLHYEGALELLSMMIDYYHFTESTQFAQETLFPLGNEILKFYHQHYPRDKEGKILFYPTQAIETYWNVENPTPVVSGLQWTLSELMKLPVELSGEENRSYWEKFLWQLPQIPTAVTSEEETIILPAKDTLNSIRKNFENPELYSIYPFRVFGLEKPGLDVAIRSFQRRQIKGNKGWFQDETQAAYLGLTDEVREMLVARAAQHHEDSRFPAFWGPNFDWIPDQDHGGNLLKALQVMTIQHQGDSILLFPSWPKEWNVSFKLCAPKNTVVEGRLENGEVKDLKVFPKERMKDIVLMLD